MRRSAQTVDDARREANEFVRQQFSKAWRADTRIGALTEFGIALHALQDSTSPAHAGFQEWTGNETRLEEFNHYRKELVDPGADSELHRATQPGNGLTTVLFPKGICLSSVAIVLDRPTSGLPVLHPYLHRLLVR